MSTQHRTRTMGAAFACLVLTVIAVGSSRLQPPTAEAAVLRSEVAVLATSDATTTIQPTSEAATSKAATSKAATSKAATSEAATSEAATSEAGQHLGDLPVALSELDPDRFAREGNRPSTGRLRFVYFVEQGEELDEEAVPRIERQAAALQQFWFDQFGGTFFLPEAGVDVVYGDHPVEWYDTTVNGDDARWYRLLNMQAEVSDALGTGAGDDVRMIVYPTARLDGRVGANRYGSAWMDGDDLTCIDGDIATTPYSSRFPANCLMTVAHELGHVYGLGHDGEDADCMQLGFYHYVNGDAPCSFSETARQAVLADVGNSGWLDALPGDRR